jgi:hypothetical protein
MTRGTIKLAINIDLQLNMVPLSLLEMVSVSFSKDFYDSIVKVSKKFEGSVWDKGITEGNEHGNDKVFF